MSGQQNEQHAASRGFDAALAWTRKWAMRVFWSGLALVVLIVMGFNVILWVSGDDAPQQPAVELSPQQVRKQQIQALVDRGEAQLIAHVKANMHDPDSFELVDSRAVDGGDHVTMVMTYRGRNGFNALRLERVAASFDLQGKVISLQKIE